MCLLFETIKVEHGIIHNLDYHNARLNRSRFELFKTNNQIKLEDQIVLPDNLGEKLYKCRVIYGDKIERIEFEPYKPIQLNRLHLVESNISYDFKYLDRSELEKLKKRLEHNEDILIVKNGFITDTSMANICFWDGKNYVTPANPLLKGTRRQFLLDQQKVFEQDIKVDDLNLFQSFVLVNAMNDLSPERSVPVNQIHF